MKVLSLFDGMSCGQIALNRAGIKYDGYYASEIDKHAIKVTQTNYPDTVQLGDITKWQEWAIDWAEIGLIMAGSPCQGFSFAGKQLAFDDPRSKLFFVFVDILRFVQSFKPDVKFLLENVKMKKEHQQVITDILGVELVEINSALVSAQNRRRLYWANWEFGQPKDKGILLKDIIEPLIDSSAFLTGAHADWWVKNKEFQLKKRYSALDPEKAICLTARQYASYNGNFVSCGSIIGRKINPESGKRDDCNPNLKAEQRIEVREDGKTGCLTTVQKDNVLVLQTPRGNNPGGIRAENGKAPCLSANGWQDNNHLICESLVRKLTPMECERLQTVPDNYTAHVSNTQRYRMLGNGWTVDVVAHILNALTGG